MRTNTEVLNSQIKPNSDLRQAFRFLVKTFPNVNLKILRLKALDLIVQSYSLSQYIFQEGSVPQFIYYILEGEVKVEEQTIAEQTPTDNLLKKIRKNRARTLMLCTVGALLGEQDALLDQHYKVSVRCTVSPTKVLVIPLKVYLELRKRNSGLDSNQDLLKGDSLLLSRISQMKQRQKQLNESPERQRQLFNKPPLILSSTNKMDLIVQQNKKILQKQNIQDLTIQAPFYITHSKSRIARKQQEQQFHNMFGTKQDSSNERTETRPRSISAPTKPKQLMKSIENTLKQEMNETKTQSNISNPSLINLSYTTDNQKPRKIQWQKLFLLVN